MVQAGLATGEFHNLTLTGGNSVSVQTNAPTPNVPGNQIGANWSKWLGQRMINGAEGCVEAVTKIGAEYSPFLAEELSKGTVYVPTLVANAGNRVIPFNPNALQRGDVIVYGDNDHVVIADGNGGYIGNSTSQEQIVADTNYYAMGGLTPTKIIKTGGGAFSTGNGGVGIYQQKPQTLKESFEDSIKAYQKAIGSVGTKTGKIVSGMYVNTNEKFDSIENDIKRIREQRQLASTFSIEEDKKATDVYLNHQEQAVQSIQEREVLLTAKQKKTKKIKTIVEKLQSIVGEYFDNPQVVCDI